MCPSVQRHLPSSRYAEDWVSTVVAVAGDSDDLVFKTKMKLPWMTPVIKNRILPFRVQLRGFYPAGNGKTSVVEVDYWSSGEYI